MAVKTLASKKVRVIELPSFKIHERPDKMHVYKVVYESVKPFNAWY